jgi:uncharacterized protein (TIGR02145 family)
MRILKINLLAVFIVTTMIWVAACKKEDNKPANTAPTGLTTTAVTNISQTTASTGGSIGASGGSDVLARGVCYDTMSSPTFDNQHPFTSNGSGIGSFSASLSDLVPGKKYFVRAYAVNAIGIAYGPEVSFNTQTPTILAPVVTTGSVSNIQINGATCAGSISSNGGAGQNITKKGIQYSTIASISPSDPKVEGTGPESGYTATLTALSANTQYYFRAYATNSAGKTGYGNVQSFTTISNPPATVSTGPVTDIWLVDAAPFYVAKATADISNLNGGTLVKKGFVWSSTNNNPTLSSKEGQNDVSDGALGNYTLTLTGLPRLQSIFVRPFATTSLGGNEVTGYGNPVKIETFVKDVEENLYNIVRIAGKLWLKENLKVTKYNDGTAIPNLQSTWNWSITSEPAWCVYNNLDANKDQFGVMYNHITVEGLKNVCPLGWHVPTKTEFDVFRSIVPGGIPSFAVNYPGWGQSGTDPWGFSLLPGGTRGPDGFFDNLGLGSWTWLKDSGPTDFASQFVLNSFVPGGIVNVTKIRAGQYIRCTKD